MWRSHVVSLLLAALVTLAFPMASIPPEEKLRNVRAEIVPQLGHANWGEISSVAFSPDGRLALSANADIKLWDVSSGYELRSFYGHSDIVTSLAFSSDGRLVVSASRDQTIKLWEVSSGQQLRSFASVGWVESVAFSSSANLILSGGQNFSTNPTTGMMELWDALTGSRLRSFGNFEGIVNSVAFSPDGNLALAASSGVNALSLWDVATGHPLCSLVGSGNVSSAAFSPNGKLIISSGLGSMAVWEVAKCREIRKFAYSNSYMLPRSLAFSTNDNLAISGASDGVRIWDVASGRELRSLEIATPVALSPDGRLILSGGIWRQFALQSNGNLTLPVPESRAFRVPMLWISLWS